MFWVSHAKYSLETMLEVDPVQIILVRKNTGYSGGDMIGKEGDVRD